MSVPKPMSMQMPMQMPMPMPPNMPNMPPPPMPMPPGMTNIPMPPGMGMPPGMIMPPGMPGMPPMPFPNPGMMLPGMMLPGMKRIKGKGPQPFGKWVNVPPNNTIYVNNLNEKTSRDEIVNGLREVFGQYGKILDITCYTKIKRCKGQAWIAFEKIESATKAIRELQNFIFFNKPMRVSYSKNVSDVTLKRDGKETPKRVRPPKKKKQKKKVITEEPKKKKKRKKSKDKKIENEDDDVEMKQNHKDKEKDSNSNSNRNSKNGNVSSKSSRNSKKVSNAPPNKTLFLQRLPKDAVSDEIQSLFIQFHGFIGLNLIENKPGIGFVEFDDTYNSSNAQRALNGYNLRGHEIMVTFAQ